MKIFLSLMKKGLSAFLLAVLVCLPGAAEVQAAGDGVQAHGPLHVSGTDLQDQNNQPVVLRGFSTHGMAWFPQYVSKDTFANMKAFGANAVRLAMYTHEYNGYCTGGDQTWLKNLVKTGVQAAEELDMYAIVDWHVLQDQNPNVYKEQAKSFFREMATAFRNKDNVLYEICNEPNGGADWNEIYRYASEIIPIIRSCDPDAVIIVGTPTWSQELDKAAARPLPYSNLMYTLHFYAGTHTDGLRQTLRNAHAAGLPVFVSEFGITDASGWGNISEEQANIWMDLLEEYKISYMNWSFCNKNEGCSAILPEVSKTSGLTFNDLSTSGKWFYSQLKKHKTPAMSAGWKQSNGRWWYQNADGSWPKRTWKQIGSKWYWFDASGWMYTGWLQNNGFWYFLDKENGFMKTDWIQDGGNWYFLKSNGAMASETFIGSDYVNARGEYVPGKHSGWAKEGSRWWYRNEDGTYPHAQWLLLDKAWYFFDPDGWMKTGWIQDGGVWYYLQSNGKMASSTTVDGIVIDSNGVAARS